MSCSANFRACAKSAANRNGISGYLSQAAGAVGSWGTVNSAIESAGGISLDLKNISGAVDNLPGTLGGLGTAASLVAANTALDTVGLSIDKDRNLRMKNAKGLLVAAHAMEYFSGAAGTMMARQFVRGKPFAKYRGVMLRRNPLIEKITRQVPKLSGGRVQPQPQEAYYFHQSGITWSGTTTNFDIVKETPKTLSVLRSHSVPHRAYYFDRKLDPRDAVDLTMGDKNPETIPGFLGKTNEIDSIVRPLKQSKQALMGLNWLSVDDSERDTRGETVVDYDAMFRKRKQNRDTISYRDLVGYRTLSYRDMIRGSGSAKKEKPAQSKPQKSVSKLATDAAAPDTASSDRSAGIANTVTYKDLANEAGAELAPATIDLPDYDTPRPLRVEAIDEMTNGQLLADAYYQTPDGEWFPIIGENAQARLGSIVVNNFIQKSKNN